MAIVGFSFSKVLIEKKEAITSKVEVKSKIQINNVSKESIELIENQDTLKFEFEYFIEYAPNLAKLEFNGQVLVTEDPKEADKILQDWKKSQKINEELQLRIYNSIFNKCNVKAFQLEEDLSLPLHLRLPAIGKNK